MAGLSDEQRRKLAAKSAGKSGGGKARQAEQARYDGGKKARVERKAGIPFSAFIFAGMLAGLVFVMGFMLLSRSVARDRADRDVQPEVRADTVTEDPAMDDSAMPSKSGGGGVIRENTNLLVTSDPDHPDGPNVLLPADQVGQGNGQEDDGSVSDGSGDEPDVPEIPEELDVPEVKPTDLVHVTLPAYLGPFTQDETDSYIETTGWYSGTVNDDGSVRYAMTPEQREAMRSSILADLDEVMSSYSSYSDSTHVTGIDPAEDRISFRVYVDEDDTDEDPWLQIIASDILRQAVLYRIYMGDNNPSLSAEFYLRDDSTDGEPVQVATYWMMNGVLS